jgi:hypothetical protein
LTSDYISDKILSPTNKYYLITTVNRTDHDAKDYATVVVHLYSLQGRLLSEVDTRFGDANKWAVGWDKTRDTIVLYSDDIDNKAFEIENGRLNPIPLTNEINKRASELEREKYKE